MAINKKKKREIGLGNLNNKNNNRFENEENQLK